MFLCSACHKDIYQAPIDATYSANFWTSQESVEQAAVSMYGLLRSSLRSTNSFFLNGDLVDGVWSVNSSTYWNLFPLTGYANNPYDFANLSYLEDLENWSRFYTLIAQANLMLLHVPNMPDNDFSSLAVKNNYLSEAWFIRAYTYYYMIRIWGDPVYVTSVYNNVNFGDVPPVPRTPQAQVLDSCLADLRNADSFMSYGGGTLSASVRANKGSVEALEAEIYAWMHNYDSCHAYCQKVITQGGYSMEPMATYSNIWAGQSSYESIFELAMTYNPNDPNFQDQNAWAEAQFGFFGLFLKGDTVQNQNYNCWIAPKYGLLGSFLFTDTTDARMKAILVHIPASSGDSAGYMMTKYANFLFQQPTSQTYPYINNDLVLLRLSDMYLLDAEAEASLGNLGAASQDLAMTETRAGITSYQNISSATNMLMEIMAERGREFIGEGSWYYDLIRTEPRLSLMEAVGYPGSGRCNAVNQGYYFPLDMGTLLPEDKLLTQIPWWSSHT
jgi:CRISPR/Cas system-associated protein endoribonuclease Cas2